METSVERITQLEEQVGESQREAEKVARHASAMEAELFDVREELQQTKIPLYNCHVAKIRFENVPVLVDHHMQMVV